MGINITDDQRESVFRSALFLEAGMGESCSGWEGEAVRVGERKEADVPE